LEDFLNELIYIKFLNAMLKIFKLIVLFVSITVFSQVKRAKNWEEAKQIAKLENKDILIEFTGSNWCKPCIKMEKEVLSNAKFQEFVKDKFVLLVFDLQMPIQTDSENFIIFDRYKKLYNVSHYPTYIVTDFDGKEKLRLKGYYSLNNFIKNLAK